MASKQVMCEMCCKEEAGGCCNTCGNIGESCSGIHKTGRAFQTHILKTFGKDGYNPKRIMYDITKEICKHHPTEKTLLFCKTHELVICGRCFRSDHIPCGYEVVDLCEEAGHIDYDQTNFMSATLNDIKNDSKRMKEEADRKKERSYTHAVKCNRELDDLKKKLKQKVEYSIRNFRQEVRKFNNKNIDAFLYISSVCEEKMAWAIEHESQLNEFVNNSFPGRLFLMSRMFDKEISKVKRQMKEAEYKHTIKQFCLKENKVTLKYLTGDLSGVCDVQEEVDGSDEGTTHSMGNSTQKPQKVEDDGSSEEITYPFWGLTENPKKEEEDESSEDSSFTVGSPPENLGAEEDDGSSEEITCAWLSSIEKPKRVCCVELLHNEEDDESSDELCYSLCSLTEKPKKSRQQLLCERFEWIRKTATDYNSRPLTSSLDATGLEVTTGRDIPARTWGPDCIWMDNRQYGRDKGDRRYAGNGGGRRHGDSDPTEGFGDGDYTISF